jgi:RNA methyltransferase, TrmH family
MSIIPVSKATLSLVRLLHQKKHRLQKNLFLVEGAKLAKETLDSDAEINCIIATRDWWEQADVPASRCKQQLLINEPDLLKISCLSQPNDVLMVVNTPQYSENSDWHQDIDSALVLDGINDPGNLGTIMRTADWFGMRKIVCSENTAEWTNPKVIQASMGSFLRTRLYYTHLEEFLKEQHDRGKAIYGAYLEGEALKETEFVFPSLIVIGSESHGISKNLSPYISQALTIHPGLLQSENGQAESLNASIATGIILYEYNRRINFG